MWLGTLIFYKKLCLISSTLRSPKSLKTQVQEHVIWEPFFIHWFQWIFDSFQCLVFLENVQMRQNWLRIVHKIKLLKNISAKSLTILRTFSIQPNFFSFLWKIFAGYWWVKVSKCLWACSFPTIQFIPKFSLCRDTKIILEKSVVLFTSEMQLAGKLAKISWLILLAIQPHV